jgi:hypothetical protein
VFLFSSTMSDATLRQPKQPDQGIKRKKRRQLVKITPWKDVYEWQLVGHKLRGALDLVRDGRLVTFADVDGLNTHELEEALQICQVWKVRCSNSLPHAIESSYCLAQLLLEDATTAANPSTTCGNTSSESITLQLSYSTAIIRSVNGLADGLQQRRRSAAPVSHLCATLGLPGWIVDIRHEATHNALPSLPQLRLAAHTLLGFFLEKYWHFVTGSRQHSLDAATQLLRDCIATRRLECTPGLKSNVVTRLVPTILSPHCTTEHDEDPEDDDDNDNNDDVGDSDQIDDEVDWLANNYFASLVRDSHTTRVSTRRPPERKEHPKKKIKTSEPPPNKPKKEVETKDHVSSILALQFVKTVPQDVAYHAALSFFIWGDEGSVGLLLSCESDHIFQPLLELLCQTWPGFLVAVVTHAVEFRTVNEHHTGDCPLAQWMRRNCDFLRKHGGSKIPARNLSGRLAKVSQLRQALEDIYLEGAIETPEPTGTALHNWTLAEHWEQCTIGILPGHVV